MLSIPRDIKLYPKMLSVKTLIQPPRMGRAIFQALHNA